MLEFLDNIDRVLFLFLNVKIANPVTDFLMPVITSNNFLRILYFLAMLLILIKGNARLRWLVVFSAITLLITDQLSAGYLKPLFARTRPCHEMMDINLLVNCGAGYAMPSAHAANSFGQAFLFSQAVKKIRVYLYLFASLVAISRVFVGVHYPFDVFFGFVVGGMSGLAVFWFFTKFEKKVISKEAKSAVHD